MLRLGVLRLRGVRLANANFAQDDSTIGLFRIFFANCCAPETRDHTTRLQYNQFTQKKWRHVMALSTTAIIIAVALLYLLISIKILAGDEAGGIFRLVHLSK